MSVARAAVGCEAVVGLLAPSGTEQCCKAGAELCRMGTCSERGQLLPYLDVGPGFLLDCYVRKQPGAKAKGCDLRMLLAEWGGLEKGFMHEL